jgi:hypothetical protein
MLKADMPNSWTLHGWPVKYSIPSVAYIAAAPWLAQVLTHAPKDKLTAFHDEAKKLTQSYGEYKTRLVTVSLPITDCALNNIVRVIAFNRLTLLLSRLLLVIISAMRSLW